MFGQRLTQARIVHTVDERSEGRALSDFMRRSEAGEGADSAKRQRRARSRSGGRTNNRVSPKHIGQPSGLYQNRLDR